MPDNAGLGRTADQPEVRLYGDCAVFTCVVTTTKNPDGSPGGGRFWNTRLFVRQAGKWLCVAWQVTPIGASISGVMALSTKEAFELYEDGKHRRYGLLFSVNGGAFAVAKLLTGEPGKPGIVLGDLSLSQLSLGMVLFTAVMIWDIFVFGLKMRENYLPGAFETQGKIVLLLLGVLLCLGWFLVGLRGAFFA